VRGSGGRKRAARAALGVTLALLCAAAPAAATTPFIHAHRGGSLENGVPDLPENTLPAFERAARRGFVLELDAKLTRDNVAVVFHDATLERVTPCSGEVADRTLAQLRAACPVDILGTEGKSVQLAAGDPRRERIPTLAEALALAKRHRARINLEIKNQPTDPDFDASAGFANRVMDVVRAGRFPPSHTIVQSFWPPNLDAAKARLPGIETSLLTLAALNDGAPAFARTAGYDWVSPGWPPTNPQAFVEQAHTLGRRIVPYTLNTPAQVKAAAAAGVDELITDDPLMARRALAEVDPAAPAIPPPPSRAECERSRAARTAPAIEAYEPRPGAPRVFAMQYKQEVRHVRSYAAFRRKIECMIREYVRPRLARDRPNVIAFNEDVGLATVATGRRGAAARALIEDPGRAPSCEPQGIPCGTLAAYGAITASYAPQVAAYQTRFQNSGSPVSTGFVAATDTFVRGWMQVFSDMARRYGVYILGSNNQPRFRESTTASEVAVFGDPEASPRSAYVAIDGKVFNEVFMWGPDDVQREGPRLLRNVVAQNKKVPLTPIERDQFQISPGAARGPDAIENVRPYTVPGTGARISFATSLPAFVYGDPPPGVDPCSDTSRYYMRCLDRLGANLVMQDEANPGRWAGQGGAGVWQPLEWMTSTWRAAADPSVSFSYNVTPHMVGNLADLAFDGQTAITQRGLRGPGTRASGGGARGAQAGGASDGCTYVGNTQPLEAGEERFRAEAGRKREFLAIAPWVAADGRRARLREVGRKLAPGSRDRLENDYVETAIAADLPFPPVPDRRGCLTSVASAAADDRGDGDDPAATPAASGGDDDAAGAGAAGRGDEEGSLPFTGLELLAFAILGCALAASGVALRRATA